VFGGSQDFGIEFTTAQLNDVLKSLTLVDLNGGRIGAVRYNSVAPLDEQLKNLQIPLSEEVASAAFLIALRGTRVEGPQWSGHSSRQTVQRRDHRKSNRQRHHHSCNPTSHRQR